MYVDMPMFLILTIHTAYKTFTEVSYSTFGTLSNFQQNSMTLTLPFKLLNYGFVQQQTIHNCKYN